MMLFGCPLIKLHAHGLLACGQIKQAFRQLCMKWHPDLCPPAQVSHFYCQTGLSNDAANVDDWRTKR